MATTRFSRRRLGTPGFSVEHAVFHLQEDLPDFVKRLGCAEVELVSLRLVCHPVDERADRIKVKATARKLLTTLKDAKLVLDWRKKQQSRAAVRVTIEKILDAGLPKAYTPELFEQRSSAVFQHIYEAYYGAGRSVYTTQ